MSEPSSKPADEDFEFKADRSRAIFDSLVKAFVFDYMTKRIARSDSGWRSLSDIAKDLGVSTSIVYAKKRDQLSPPVLELVQRGFAESRYFQREKGRGGEVMRLRIVYENELIKDYVEKKIRGVSLQKKIVPKVAEAIEMAAESDDHKIPKVANDESNRLRIAVLPFANISPDSADEYFADGMTEELISAVSLINGLSVISRTSVMSYKESRKRTYDIGRELNVGTLLEGSVRKAGNRVRISVQLIDVDSDAHLWVQNYDRNLEDIFTIQSDIAQRVAQSLESQLLPGRKHRIENANTRNVDAHLLYLKGRDAFFKFTRDAFETSLEYYEEAIQKDPRYALAYAAMAESYWFIGEFEYVVPVEAFSKTKEFANKAISFDNTMSEAHMALGYSLMSADWNFDAAEKELRRSIELNPSASRPHTYLGIFLAATSERFDEAEAEVKIALDLDPFSSFTCLFAGTSYYYARNYHRAIEILERAVKLNPLNELAVHNLGISWVHKGEFQKGIEEMERAVRMDAPNISAIAELELAYGYWKAGYESKPAEILSFLLDGIEKHPSWAMAIAGVYSFLGEKEKAFDWLEKAFKVRSGHLPYSRLMPEFDNIRSDPRFLDLFVRVGTVKTVDAKETVSNATSVSAKLDSKRIAVLPFSNISPDPKDEYFADGMTEELISTLSRVRELKVISRTSVMRYKQTEKSLSEIASELNVNAILEGSVRKMGDDLRITAQLIDVQNDEHLWSEDYDRKFENVFSLQREIALKVVDSLKVSILAKENREMGKKTTRSLEAYTLYLKARLYSYRMALDSFNKAIEYCQKAVEIDPSFAQAYAEIARCYTLGGATGLMPSDEAFDNARRFAEKAILLDDSIPESHLALATEMLYLNWDFVGSERESRRALELNPSYVGGYLELSDVHCLTRRFEEAYVETKRALELDPLSASTCTLAGLYFVFGGYYKETIDVLRNAIELEPSSVFAHDNLGYAYVETGLYETGISEIKKGIELAGDHPAPFQKNDLAYAYAKAGKNTEVRKILDELLVSKEKNEVPDTVIAGVYVSLSEFDRALEYLEKAYQHHEPYLNQINADRSFEKLRPNPKFQALLKKIGF